MTTSTATEPKTRKPASLYSFDLQGDGKGKHTINSKATDKLRAAREVLEALANVPGEYGQNARVMFNLFAPFVKSVVDGEIPANPLESGQE